MSYFEMNNIVKRYAGAPVDCLSGLSLHADKGSVTAVLGASGCGKTTLLKIAAGLEAAQRGGVSLDGAALDALPAEKRPIAMVFQKPLLFENMNVSQNVNFSPRVNRLMRGDELRLETGKYLELVHMEDMAERRVSELSGGQAQRVSLARALMTKPKLLLLDEPLSALDANLKLSMEDMICTLSRELGTTMLYVTHDQREACAVADKIALMHGGRIVQFSAPSDFYRRPLCRYSAEFFGWRNFIDAEKNGEELRSPLGVFHIPSLSGADGTVTLCIRPEAAVNAGHGRLCGLLRSCRSEGADMLCRLECAGVPLTLRFERLCSAAIGEAISFDLDETLMWAVDG